MPVFQLTDALIFPPPVLAEDGLLAVGGDLSEDRLLLAYRTGIFPWYSEEEPILWWSPDPRLILIPDEFHASRRLDRLVRQGVFSVTFDTAFDRVIEACGQAPRPGQDGTWITPEMREAYIGLHESGYAHSVECWQGEALAGGLYGVSLGRCFFGESMFSTMPNASKVALAALVRRLRSWSFDLIDCQVYTPHLCSLGAREIPREAFLEWLDASVQWETRRGKWTGHEHDEAHGSLGSHGPR